MILVAVSSWLSFLILWWLLIFEVLKVNLGTVASLIMFLLLAILTYAPTQAATAKRRGT